MVRYFFKETVPPSELPVILSEVKEFLRIKDSFIVEDNLLTNLIKSAVSFGERYCRRQFIQRSWEGYFSGIEINEFDGYYFNEIIKSPVYSLVDVYSYESDQYVPFTNYIFEPSNNYSRIIFTSLPNYDINYVYPIKVVFDSGFGDSSMIPEEFKLAIKTHIAFMYENRGDVQAVGKERFPEQLKSIYKSLKIITF